MIYPLNALLMAATLLTGGPGAALAQAPARAPAPAPGFHIEGFRGARWGMTPDQTRAAIVKDFAVKPADISQVENPLEHTTALIVKVAKLDPGPGPAVVTYIFGASKRTLMHINVAWTLEGQLTDAQRAQIAVSAVQLSSYFQSQTWPPKSVKGQGVLGPNRVMMFQGIDDAGGAVELVTFGVATQARDAAKPTAAPTGPAQLLVSYSADFLHPDVFQVAPGAF